MHRGDAQRPDAIFQASHTSKSHTNPTPTPLPHPSTPPLFSATCPQRSLLATFLPMAGSLS